MSARLSHLRTPKKPRPGLQLPGDKAQLGLYQGSLADAVLSHAKHLLCLILPLTTFLFLTTGLLNKETHSLITGIAWTLPFWLILLLDWKTQNLSPNPATVQSTRFYDGILYLLAGLQLANIFCMALYISQLRWETTGDIFISLSNLVIIRFLVGTSSGTSGIVLAHELIHRPQLSWRIVGRLLLCTVCYDHFVITHKRGHHQSLGLPDDIATARLGESFKHYWRRVYPGYFRYAWRSEQERLARNSSWDKLANNQVLHGLFFEFALLGLIYAYFGWLAALMFLYQAVAAVRILEAVNYFQHWGLENGQFGNTYGWVSHSSLSRYALIGLSHHIGHHEDESKHFHEIALFRTRPNHCPTVIL